MIVCFGLYSIRCRGISKLIGNNCSLRTDAILSLGIGTFMSLGCRQKKVGGSS